MWTVVYENEDEDAPQIWAEGYSTFEKAQYKCNEESLEGMNSKHPHLIWEEWDKGMWIGSIDPTDHNCSRYWITRVKMVI